MSIEGSAIAVLANGGGNKTVIENLVLGTPVWLRDFVGPIVVAVGIVLIIAGVVQLARYFFGKSNGGGQSRVNIVFSIVLIVFGGACVIGGRQFASTLVQNSDSLVTNITDKAGTSTDQGMDDF